LYLLRCAFWKVTPSPDNYCKIYHLNLKSIVPVLTSDWSIQYNVSAMLKSHDIVTTTPVQHIPVQIILSCYVRFNNISRKGLLMFHSVFS